MMVNKSGYIVVFVMILSVAGSLMVTGCSDSPSRSQGRDILQEVNKAQRLYERAMMIMGGAVFEVGGQMPPFLPATGKKISVSDITMLPETQLNPKVLDDLNKAAKILRKALQDNADAPKTGKSLARETLARVLMFKGYCESFKSAVSRSEMAGTIDGVRRSMCVIRNYEATLAYLDKLISSSDKDVRGMISTTKLKVSGLQSKILKTDKEIAEKQRESVSLKRKIDQINAKYRELKQQSDSAKGLKSLELFKNALNYKGTAGKFRFQLSQVKHDMECLKTDVSDLRTQLASARKMLKIATDTIGKREEKIASLRESREVIVQALTKARKDVEGAGGVSGLADIYGRFAEADKKALSYYREAAEFFKKAGQGTPVRDSVDTLCGEALALISSGALQANSLQVKGAVSSLVDDVSALWKKRGYKLIPGLEKIRQYAGQGEKVRKSAGEKFAKAAKLYQKVEKAAATKVKWIYQTHLANAYYRLSQVQKDSNSLQKAKTAIAKAVKGKSKSPYLVFAVQLEQMINRAGE